jgi:H+/Cl- antiporter ClcA
MSLFKKIPWIKVNYVLKGILVGAIAGAVVSAFRMVIYVLLDFMPILYEFLKGNITWTILWLGVLLIAATLTIILVRDEPNIQGNGVAELKGQLQGTLKLNWFSVFWRKFVSSSIVLGLGIPLGQEGPSIQIGGVVGQGINKLMKGNNSQENIFISSGAAAGLAAAFNAPLSAFVLILEEIHHRFSNILILSVFSASITASFVAFNIFGSEPAIGLGPTFALPLEHYFYLIGLGIILALGGWVFQRGIFYVMPIIYGKLPIPRYLHGYIPFVLLLFTGLFWTEMIGGGTNVIMTIASERFATTVLIAVLVFRFIMFQIAMGSGIPGGSLVPSLAFGALIGAIYGNIVINLTGIEDQFVRNFVIYGMGGFFTSTTKAPLTAIVLITELTGSMNQMAPISIVCLTAYIISDMLGLEPTDDITLDRKTTHYPTVFKGEVVTFNVTVQFDSVLDGLTLKELTLPYNSRINKITRNERTFIPHKDNEFMPGDLLEVACDAGFISQIQKQFEKINE